MSQITSHVLDTSLGKPGQGILIELQEITFKGWKTIGSETTDDDGRVKNLLPEGKILDPGSYQLVFHTGKYYIKKEIQNFFPEVRVQFIVSNDSHYHVPLLLSPYSYSTYRGS